MGWDLINSPAEPTRRLSISTRRNCASWKAPSTIPSLTIQSVPTLARLSTTCCGRLAPHSIRIRSQPVAPTLPGLEGALSRRFAEHRAPGLVSLYHLAEVVGRSRTERPHRLRKLGSAIEVFLLAYRARKGRACFTPPASEPWDTASRSIGVCLGSGGKKTICVDGDGAFNSISRNWPLSRTCNCRSSFSSLITRDTLRFAPVKRITSAPPTSMQSETGVSIPDYRKVARAYGLKTAVIEGQGEGQSDLRAPSAKFCAAAAGGLRRAHHSRRDQGSARYLDSTSGWIVRLQALEICALPRSRRICQNMIVEPVSE